MGKRKLKRFAENKTFENLFQPSYQDLENGFEMKGNWNNLFFENTNPIVLELGCGKGEFTTGLASKYTEKNFIGVDIKGARMWRGLKTAQEENLNNVAFVRTRIELIEHFFGNNEVDEIWITFPDPRPKKYQARKRLTSPRFLNLYRNILKPQNLVHLKTDNPDFYKYSHQVAKTNQHTIFYSIKDLYASKETLDVMEIKTFYEMMWLEEGKKIHYLRYQLNIEKENHYDSGN